MTENITGQNNNQKIDDKELWRQWAVKAQDGDTKAYGLLLRGIAPYIRNTVIAGLANPDWADDIVQEVLLSVHKSLGTYDGNCDFTPWLHAIINFRKSDFLRQHYKNKDRKEQLQSHNKVTGENVTISRPFGELKDIEKALAILPEKQRKSFVRVKVEGYTAREVANEMGMSISAVKVSVHRATHKLKKLLNA